MKFIKDYIKEKLRLQPLGELSVREIDDASVSVSVDEQDTGIVIFYSEYAEWLENRVITIKV